MEWAIKVLHGAAGFRFAIVEERTGSIDQIIATAPTEQAALRLIEALQIRQDVLEDTARYVRRELARRN